MQNQWLVTAYRVVHKVNPPAHWESYEIAEQVVEALGDPNWVPVRIARRAVCEIVLRTWFPAREMKQSVVEIARYVASHIFTEFRDVREVGIHAIEAVDNAHFGQEAAPF